ncbi:hypothetical protein [Spirosoma jeollabukense]
MVGWQSAQIITNAPFLKALSKLFPAKNLYYCLQSGAVIDEVGTIKSADATYTTTGNQRFKPIATPTGAAQQLTSNLTVRRLAARESLYP